MAYPRCPLCNSIIVDTYSHLLTTATEGNNEDIVSDALLANIQALSILDEDYVIKFKDYQSQVREAFKTQKIYIWTDDPIYTLNGIAGDNYKGITDLNIQHIQEIQEARNQQEEDLSLAQTSFSNLSSPTNTNKKHIRELRQSTELILNQLGKTLSQYFNYDKEDNYLGTYKYGVKKTDKSEWTNIARSNDIPYLPSETMIHLIPSHIEELRREIQIAKRPLWYTLIGWESGLAGEINLWTRICEWGQGFQNYHYISLGSSFVADIEKTHTCCPTYPTEYACKPYSIGAIYWSDIRDRWERSAVSPVTDFNIGESEVYYNAKKTKYEFPSWNAELGASPYQNNLQFNSVVMEMYSVNPILVDETPGYPSEKYALQYQYWSRPKFKSCGYLEDAVTTATTYTLNKYLISDNEEVTSHFHKDSLPCVMQAGGSEEAFEVRHMDATTGVVFPLIPFCMQDTKGINWWENYVAISGTQPTGVFSIFVPTEWNLANLDFYKDTKIIELYTLDYDDITYCLDIRNEVLGSGYNPKTQVPYSVLFKNNCLLSKNDGIEWIAKNKHELSEIIHPQTPNINIPDATIAISVTLTIDGIEWTQVTDFSEYGANDKVYIVSAGKIVFGDGVNGARVTQQTTAEIECYSEELAITKFYPEGLIVLANHDVEELEGTSYYIKINYYNVPHRYGELIDPTTYYINFWFDEGILDSETVQQATRQGTDPAGAFPAIGVPLAQYHLGDYTAELPSRTIGIDSFRTLTY